LSGKPSYLPLFGRGLQAGQVCIPHFTVRCGYLHTHFTPTLSYVCKGFRLWHCTISCT
jgi:hypothetical protein